MTAGLLKVPSPAEMLTVMSSVKTFDHAAPARLNAATAAGLAESAASGVTTISIAQSQGAAKATRAAAMAAASFDIFAPPPQVFDSPGWNGSGCPVGDAMPRAALSHPQPLLPRRELLFERLAAGG